MDTVSIWRITCPLTHPSTRVLESLKAGKRLPEARFANLKVAARGQLSVLGVFSKKT